MAQVSQHYLDGIREGRESFELLRGFLVGLTGAELLAHVEKQAGDLESFRVRMAGMAYSDGNIQYVNGQIDFMKNQAKRLSAVATIR